MLPLKEIISYNLKNNLEVKWVDTKELLKNYQQFLKYKKLIKKESPKTYSNIEKIIEAVKRPKNQFQLPPIFLSLDNENELVYNNYLIISVLLEYVTKLIEHNIHRINAIDFFSTQDTIEENKNITFSKILIIDLIPVLYKRSLNDKEQYMQNMIKFINKRQNNSLITFVLWNKELIDEFKENVVINKFLQKNIYHYLED